MKEWVIMQTYQTKEFIRCRPERVPYLRSIGWRDAWDVYREKYREREAMNAQFTKEMDAIKVDIEAVEKK